MISERFGWIKSKAIETQIIFVKEVGYLNNAEGIEKQIESLKKMINSLISLLKRKYV